MEGGIFRWVKGDRVVWIVVLLLIMISMIAISGSTSLLALSSHTTRMSLMTKHMAVCLGGLAIILACSCLMKVSWLERLSKLGFIVSLALLAFLLSHCNSGKENAFIKVEYLNQAYRTIRVGPVQIHVFEVVKVAMVMYLAWACRAYRENSFRLAKKLAALNIYVGKAHDRRLFAFLEKRWVQAVVYILLPIVLTMGMILPNSNSSAIFIGGVMVVTALIGGLDFKYILATGVIGAGIVAGAYGLNRATNGEMCSRIVTGISRMEKKNVDDLFRTRDEKGADSKEYEKVLVKVQQPYAARIAIHEGGLFGKGIGGSTQKYVVPIMYGDFMFSYILEETGIFGGLAIIILYLSLLARGSVIVSNSDNEFAKTCVGGLVILIAGQAFMHMLVNLDIGFMTGQTLPMISHGSGSFICFSVAFGVILALSRTADKKTSEEERQADIEHGRPVEDSISTDTGDF